MLRGLRACVRLRALPVKARQAKQARDSRYQTPINSASRHQNLNDVRLTRAASMSNGGEESAAKKAAAEGLVDSEGPTIFDKIISKEIPANVIYEDDKCLAFRDINPQAPVHFLVIPKVRDGLTRLSRAHEGHKEILGHLLYTAQKVAKDEGLGEGFRVAINDGPGGCQSVYHLHLHVIGGRQLTWPPG
mmetsp:Transcript_1629/g.6022  ORF Transcript_1629/g.6022 Transcript_1629/m.6022 type:complete len:189 (-) Transcript_1629:97-663(-)